MGNICWKIPNWIMLPSKLPIGKYQKSWRYLLPVWQVYTGYFWTQCVRCIPKVDIQQWVANGIFLMPSQLFLKLIQRNISPTLQCKVLPTGDVYIYFSVSHWPFSMKVKHFKNNIVKNIKEFSWCSGVRNQKPVFATCATTVSLKLGPGISDLFFFSYQICLFPHV